MRKKANKLLALLTAVAITVTGVNVPANNASAASAKLSKKKITLTAGKKKTIYLKKGKKKLAIKSVKSSKKKVATVKKSGKKIIITAKKKGTATITVKAKVNKKVKSFKCKVTVKAKAKASAAPSAAASSAPASQAPASPVPSDAPSAVPSDAASAAPSADASASPSADASAVPSAAPSEEPYTQEVSEIKILNSEALTNPDGDKAYVYYDVLDQKGVSMRESVDIQWNTSPAGGKADKVLGRLTIPKNSGSTATGSALQKFTYGEKIFITGVHVKSGIVINESVTVGMAQAVNDIEVAGFVNKNNPTELLKDLPKNFAKNTYYMVFRTFDQNGNPLDVSEEEFASKNLTFVPDNPLLLTLENTGVFKNFTVKGTAYAAVQVEPGDYVDKGGEVNIMVVANKTGNKKNINIVIGANPQLKSLELLSPKGTVADGDTGVEIPFKAYDTDGNEVTNYETIVRSNNTLTLNAGDDTELVVYEKEDGTAAIKWSDKTDFRLTKENNPYSKTGVADGIDRQISLTTIVVGGESNNLMLAVSDMRIPAQIASTCLKEYASAGTASKIDITSTNQYWDAVTFNDQYGKALARDNSVAFLASAGKKAFGTDDLYYGVKVDVQDTNNHFKAYDSSGDWGSLTGKDVVLVSGGKTSVQFSPENVTKVEADDVKVSLATSKSNTAAVADWNNASKVVTVTMNNVPQSKVKNLAIDGLNDTYELETASGDALAPAAETAAGTTVTGVNVVNDNPSDTTKTGRYGFEVKGTYNGNSVTVSAGIKEDTTSSVLGLDGDNKLNKINNGLVPYSRLFDYKTYGTPAKVAALELVVNVAMETDNGVAVASPAALRKDVNVCAAAAEVTSLSFAANGLQPTGGVLNIGSIVKDVKVLSQYGRAIAQYNEKTNPSGPRVVYTISDYEENTGDLAHVKGNWSFNNNGTDKASVVGAEIGDKFKVTAKIQGTTITKELEVTVKADTMARIGYFKGAIDADKTFRTAKSDGSGTGAASGVYGLDYKK